MNGGPESAVTRMPLAGAGKEGAARPATLIRSQRSPPCRCSHVQPEPSLHAVQPGLGDLDVLRLLLDPDPGEALHLAGDSGGSTSEEWVKDRPSRRGDEAHEVTHELQGLHGRMDVLAQS